MKTLLTLAFLPLAALAAAERVTGTLLDPQGKPLAGAVLSGYAFQAGGAERDRFTELRATTDAKGAFVLEAPSLPSVAAPIVLLARLPNGLIASVRLVASGSPTKVPGESSSLRVVATDLQGKPLKDVSVGLTLLLSGNMNAPVRYFGSLRLPKENPEMRTDAQGVATFIGLPIGAEATLGAERPGRVASPGRRVVLTGGKTMEEKLSLGRAGILAGRVLRDGQPVPGVTVVASTVMDQQVRSARAKTDAQGTYRIEKTFPGSNSVGLDLGPLGERYTAKPYEAVRVREGGELNGLDFVLDEGVVLTGRVLTKVGGKPVPGASLYVRAPGEISLRRTTDAEGRFTARVPAGQSYVSVERVGERSFNGRAYLWATVDRENNPPLELRVPDASLLAPIPHLEGTVTDVAGNPVAGATVRNLRAGEAKTDATGHFRFETPTDAGSLLVAVEDEAMSSVATVVGSEPTVALKLDGKPTALTGRLVDAAGKPLAGAEVTLGGKMEDAYYDHRTVTSDANGTYRFENLYGGLDEFYLWAKLKGYGPVTVQPIRTTPGETKTLDTQTLMLADGVIEGKVLEPDGKPAGGVTVSSQVQDVPQALTDDAGRFKLTGVPRGEHYLVAGRGNSFGAGAKGATGQKDVVIKLEPPVKETAGVVSGDRSGQAAPALKVAEWTGGTPLDLAALKGKIVVIDFWAVWCRPCIESLPAVQALADRYGKDGVVVLGIHTPDRTKEQVAAFVKEKGLRYPNALDAAEKTGVGSTALAFGPSGIPHLFVIDRDGKIAVDTHETEDVERTVKRLLAKS